MDLEPFAGPIVGGGVLASADFGHVDLDRAGVTDASVETEADLKCSF